MKKNLPEDGGRSVVNETVKKEELNILLTEYQTLKDEEKTIFSFQFTVIGIWLTFLGVMIGVLFGQIEAVENYAYEKCANINIPSEELAKYVDEIIKDVQIMSQSRMIIVSLVMILIPGTCALFALIWLDLTTRFVKEAHYIFLIENKILVKYPGTIGFDHFLYEETKKERGLKKTNYVYYFIMIGAMLICPLILVGYFHFFFARMYALGVLHIICFLLIEVFAFSTAILYIRRILSYANAKKRIEKIW